MQLTNAQIQNLIAEETQKHLEAIRECFKEIEVEAEAAAVYCNENSIGHFKSASDRIQARVGQIHSRIHQMRAHRFVRNKIVAANAQPENASIGK